MNKCITIIRGASGVGKTTILHSLLNNKSQLFCVDVDSIRCMFSKMDWKNGYNEYVSALEITISIIDKLIALGYCHIIVADTFRPSQLFDFIGKLNHSYEIYSLFCDNDVLKSRLTKRDLPSQSFNEIIEYNDRISKHDLPECMEKEGVVQYFDVTQEIPSCFFE